MEILLEYGLPPLLVTIGCFLGIWGMLVVLMALYRCIPFIGETLQSRQHDVIDYHERLELRRQGIWGLCLYMLGMVFISGGAWMIWIWRSL